jgi:hypothetical protein
MLDLYYILLDKYNFILFKPYGYLINKQKNIINTRYQLILRWIFILRVVPSIVSQLVWNVNDTDRLIL